MASFRKKILKKGGIVIVAVVRRKKINGDIYQKSKTFTKQNLAEAWARNLEAKIDETGIEEDSKSMTVAELISAYQEKFAHMQKWGRSKEFSLNAIKRTRFAGLQVDKLKSKDFVDYALARRESAQGSTVSNDLTHLHAVLLTAQSVFGIKCDLVEFEEARRAMTANKVIHKAKKRDRRPTDEEIERICDQLENKNRTKKPMRDIIWFAIHSTRRQDEIMRLRWEDLDEEKMTCVVRDLKHPTDKEGNHQTFKMLPEALEIIQRQPRDSEFIFPYNTKAISALFTRTCKLLNIEDLRFHDLRHEAVSRLFERGYQIHEVCMFSLHVNWDTLRRYTNLRAEDVREL